MKSILGRVRHPASKWQRALNVAVLLVLLMLVFVLLKLVHQAFGIGIPCPLNAVTGLFCPGCGMFRAVNALLRGDLWQAFRYNAFSVILLPLLLIFGAREAARYIRAASFVPSGRWEMRLCMGIAVVCVVYGFLRNVPFFAILQPVSL
ncbi:MAG: DUF2752 domain-containing protein [Peptococcaceae bacterium]|nr:DUF2752 domain-containing protein [Peptococcaceae bacterium]